MENETNKTGMSRVKVLRPRPKYKSKCRDIEDDKYMWKNIALGLTGLFILSLCLLFMAMHGTVKAQNEAALITITPGR